MSKVATVQEVKTGLKELSVLAARRLIVCRPITFSKHKGFQLTVCMDHAEANCSANIFFSKKGNFQEAAVFEPGRYKHCRLEGLSKDEALLESQRWVTTAEDLQKFFERKPYNWDGKKKWLKAIGKA